MRLRLPCGHCSCCGLQDMWHVHMPKARAIHDLGSCGSRFIHLPLCEMTQVYYSSMHDYHIFMPSFCLKHSSLIQAADYHKRACTLFSLRKF